MKLKSHRVGGERPARQPRPFDRAFAFLDPLLACSALIVEGNNARSAGRLMFVTTETDARIKLSRMPFHFGDYRRGLVQLPAWQVRPAPPRATDLAVAAWRGLPAVGRDVA